MVINVGVRQENQPWVKANIGLLFFYFLIWVNTLILK